MKLNHQKAAFLFLGATSFATWYFIASITPYWSRFYTVDVVTIVAVVYQLVGVASSFIAQPLIKYLGNRVFMLVFAVVNSVTTLAIVPLQTLNNQVLQIIIISVLIAMCSLCSNAMFPLVIGESTQNEQLALYVQIGVGVCSASVQVVEDVIYIVTNALTDDGLLLNVLLHTVVVCILYSFVVPVFVAISRKSHEVNDNLQDLNLNRKADEHTNNVETLSLIQNQDCKDEQKMFINDKSTSRSVLKRIFPSAFMFALSNIVTPIMFPLFVTNIPCHLLANQHITKNDAWSLTLLTTNMVSDLIGRLLPLLPIIQRKVQPRHLNFMCGIRLLFGVIIPLMCFPRVDFALNKYPLIRSDITAVITAGGLAVSQSFVNTCMYMKYQNLLQTKDEKQRGSFILNQFLTVGAFVAAVSVAAMMPLFG